MAAADHGMREADLALLSPATAPRFYAATIFDVGRASEAWWLRGGGDDAAQALTELRTRRDHGTGVSVERITLDAAPWGTSEPVRASSWRLARNDLIVLAPSCHVRLPAHHPDTPYLLVRLICGSPDGDVAVRAFEGLRCRALLGRVHAIFDSRERIELDAIEARGELLRGEP